MHVAFFLFYESVLQSRDCGSRFGDNTDYDEYRGYYVETATSWHFPSRVPIRDY